MPFLFFEQVLPASGLELAHGVHTTKYIDGFVAYANYLHLFIDVFFVFDGRPLPAKAAKDTTNKALATKALADGLIC